jgi:hypothetical protein
MSCKYRPRAFTELLFLETRYKSIMNSGRNHISIVVTNSMVHSLFFEWLALNWSRYSLFFAESKGLLLLSENQKRL